MKNSRPKAWRSSGLKALTALTILTSLLSGSGLAMPLAAKAQGSADMASADLQGRIYDLLDQIHGLQDALSSRAGEVLGASTGSYDFSLSLSPDRSNPVPLAGATVSGKIYPFLQTGSEITSIQFYLDDPQMTKPPLRTEIAPFDFGGGSLTVAYPFDTTNISDGVHTATAKMNSDAGAQKISASFTVANNKPPAIQYDLYLSSSPDRSNPVLLSGKTVSGSIYVFTGPDKEVSSVKFYLDDPQMTKPPLRTEIAPFDFGGGSLTVAYPYKTENLANGQHTITAAMTLDDAKLKVISAGFTVKNGTPPSAGSFELNISKDGSGSGKVASVPAGIDCGSDCSGSYASGTVVQLTATPDQNSAFAAWKGNSDCADGKVTVRGAMSCTATFNLKPVAGNSTSTLAVSRAGDGSGTVTSEPAGINCGTSCSAAFASGTVVALTATAATGSTFLSWSGDADCSDGSLKMSGSRNCTATFVKDIVVLPPTSSVSSIQLSVNEYSGVRRNGEILSSGVPLPESLGLKDTSSLRVTDPSGHYVPAQFRVIARWGGGRNDSTKPIQWVLVNFAAAVSPNSVSGYHLLTDGSGANPSSPTALSVSQQGNQVTVNTGAATFVIGPNALFDQVKTADGSVLVNGGALSATINGTSGDAGSGRSVSIRSANSLEAIVEVKGTYNLAFGGGAVSFTRRYDFSAGSPTAIIRHTVDWEGTFSGNSWWATGKTPTDFNMVEGQKLRDTLNLAFTPSAVRAVSSFDATNDIPYTGQEVALRTLLRNKGADGLAARWQPRKYELTSGGALVASGSRSGLTASGKVANGGMLAMQGSGGTLAIALDHMQDYEPQALRLLPGNKAAIDIADDKFRLAMFQGLFANMAVSALPANASRTDLDQKVWAPLNQPLRALPTAQWLNQTQAWDKIPAGPLPASLSSYSSLMPGMLQRTMTQEEHEGLFGLVTTGLWPRYWAEYSTSPSSPGGEIASNNPEWDGVFRDTTWTDYYSTTAAATMWSLTSGQPRYIDELSAQAALRTLHTQIFQGAPGSNLSAYFGQAPGGYGGFRSDFNSKHQYWDNLFLYYYLTGDESIPDIVQRGGVTQMGRYNNGNSDEVGAPSALWLAAFRFLGGTVEDTNLAAQFATTFRTAASKIITSHYAELSWNGETYGFLANDNNDATASEFDQTSAWTLGGYDMENLYWLMKITNDAPVGPYGVTPSRAMKNIAKTFVKILPSPTLLTEAGIPLGGDGTIAGKWARQIHIVRSGNQVGGTATSITAVEKQGEPLLYPGDKPFFAAFLTRAARLPGADPAIGTMAKSLVNFALPRMNNMVLGKLGGLGVNRLITAVADEAGF